MSDFSMRPYTDEKRLSACTPFIVGGIYSKRDRLGRLQQCVMVSSCPDERGRMIGKMSNALEADDLVCENSPSIDNYKLIAVPTYLEKGEGGANADEAADEIAKLQERINELESAAKADDEKVAATAAKATTLAGRRARKSTKK